MIVWPPEFLVWGGPWPLGPPPGYATVNPSVSLCRDVGRVSGEAKEFDRVLLPWWEPKHASLSESYTPVRYSFPV